MPRFATPLLLALLTACETAKDDTPSDTAPADTDTDTDADADADTDADADADTDTDTDTDTGTPCPEEPEGTDPPETLDCDLFSADLVLTDDPDRPVDYFVDCVASVGGDLRIEPGTVIAFGDDRGLRVNGGRLDIQGDACNPVVLKGEVETAGAWRGIIIDNDGSKGPVPNHIAFAEILHTGSGPFNSNGDTGAIILWSANDLTLTDSRIAEGASHGLNVTATSATGVLERNHFEDLAGDGVYAPATFAEFIDEETTFGDTLHPIGLTGGSTLDGAVWRPWSTAAYVYPGQQISASGGLTMEAGVELAFDDDAGLSVGGTESPLHIDGTATDPVVLRGSDDVPGHWRGIIIDNNGGKGAANSIAFAEVRNAGGGAHNSNGDLGGLILWAGNELALTDTTIADSADVGLNLTYGDSSVTLARNHFEGNASHAIYGAPEYMDAMDPDSTFVGNGGDHVAVFGGAMADEASIAALQVPYYVLEDGVVSTNHPLTIEAGAHFVFEANAGLEISGVDSPLHIAGTPLDRVVLEGSAPDRGHWRGLIIDNNSSVPAENLLDNVDILHAGGGSFNSNGDLGGLILWADNHLTLRDVSIAESGAVGLNATYGGSTLILEGVNVFTGNASAPAWLEPTLASAMGSDDVFSGNDYDYVVLTEGGVAGTHTWQALDVPYRLTSVTEIFYTIDFADESQWNAEPGVEVVFDANTGISSVGDVDIAGSAAEPVVFRGSAPVAGHWRGLFFSDADDASDTYYVDWAEIRDAGGNSFNSNGDLAGIMPWADTSLSVTNTTFANLAAACAINSRYYDPNTDVYNVAGSTTDGSTQLLCDPDDL